MTKEQFETSIKAIMEATTERLQNAESDKEKIMILENQNIMIQAILDLYK